MRDFILLFLVAVSAADYIKRKSGSECNSGDTKLGTFSSVEECADACRRKDGCKFFIYGHGSKSGSCWWEYTKTADCSEGWETDKYNFYEVAGCPEKFATADMLYCNGSCGDDWLDDENGCQQADADAYCKLKLCDENASASSFDVTTATNKPGFSCDGNGKSYGNWFGMQGVYFKDDVKSSHGSGDVVSNVVCKTLECPAKFSTADSLYCNGSCGDDWLDTENGCQQADADAYCKLKLCDANAFARSFKVTKATNTPGFACDGLGKNYGNWFGMKGVYFEGDVKNTHGSGDVVSNVVCQTSVYSNVCDQCWCGSSNRKDLGRGVSLEECRSLCTDKAGCLGIEFWHGGGLGICNQCLEPAQHIAYANKNDLAWPPSVYSIGRNVPENCEWNSWQTGTCSKTCGGGTRTNTRTKKKDEINGGMCEGKSTMQEACNTQTCPPIHCQWNDWVLGECSEPCGTGKRTNTRTKKVVEKDGGTCTGQPTEEEKCKIKECPVHCEWGPWEVTECDKKCGGGTLTETRKIAKEAEHDGNECTGESIIPKSCNVQECPVNCKWGEWVLGDCSADCGGGIRLNYREKIQQEIFGGTCEGQASDKQDCNMDPCPEPCTWNDWELGECSATCGGGTRLDTRTKKTEARYGGSCDSTGHQREKRCNTEKCPPIHCEWNDWVIGECSKECGTGRRTNNRTKLTEEKNGGTCTGQDTEEEECKVKECPVHCEWDDWQIGKCSLTCGGGNRTNTREKKQTAEHGGNECEGLSSITESCNENECPVDCKWSDWVFEDCSKSCGYGMQIATRTIEEESKFGGQECKGKASVAEPCFIEECPPACPEEKSPYCKTYVSYYGDRFCEDTPQNEWFLGAAGRYSCRKSCGLC